MTFKDIIEIWALPILLFTPSLGAVYHFMFSHMYASGTSAHIRSLCANKDASSTPFLLTYTKVPLVDRFLCILVTTFHAAFASENITYTLYIFLTLGIVIIIPPVEATRKGRPVVLAFPLIVGLLSQTMTAAHTFSIYYLVFVLSGAARLHVCHRGDKAYISAGHAKATVYGLLIGMGIPSTAMLFMDHPYITAAWQPYPIFSTLAQSARLLLSSPSEKKSSGYTITQATFFIGFISSAVAHFTIVLPQITNLSALKNTLLPSITALDHKTTTLEQGVINFLKWDGILSIIPCMLSTLWFARDIKDFFGILAWHVVATLAFGPGAAIAGVFMWREALLNGPKYETKAVERKKK